MNSNLKKMEDFKSIRVELDFADEKKKIQVLFIWRPRKKGNGGEGGRKEAGCSATSPACIFPTAVCATFSWATSASADCLPKRRGTNAKTIFLLTPRLNTKTP
jgi:hypothetical protein